MRLAARALPIAALLAASTIFSAAEGQTPPPAPAPAATPTPPPASPGAPAAASAAPGAQPTPTAAQARIVEPPALSIARLPAENPFGITAEVPAALPARLPFADATVAAAFFVSVHVDPSGKALSVRRDRDPIPSLAGESLRSLSRWVFSPARRSGQAVDTWGAFRLELDVQIRSPKVVQMAFNPVTPSTPILAPFDWAADADWLESRRPPPPSDGSVPIDQVETAPMPQKTPWSADSYKGPFTVRYWVRVDKSGHIDRAIPLEVSDPVLLSYFRKAMASWAIRPAQSGGATVETWNELTLGGQISYSVEIKQIAALRRGLGNP